MQKRKPITGKTAYRQRTMRSGAVFCAWLLVLLIPAQGIAQAMGGILTPAHFHALSALALERASTPEPTTMDDDTVLAYIGKGSPAVDRNNALVASHAHRLGDASVVYVDAGRDGKPASADKAPADGAVMMLPTCERPLLANLPMCPPGDPRIAYRSRIVPPLERPPSRRA